MGAARLFAGLGPYKPCHELSGVKTTKWDVYEIMSSKSCLVMCCCPLWLFPHEQLGFLSVKNPLRKWGLTLWTTCWCDALNILLGQRIAHMIWHCFFLKLLFFHLTDSSVFQTQMKTTIMSSTALWIEPCLCFSLGSGMSPSVKVVCGLLSFPSQPSGLLLSMYTDHTESVSW